MSFARTFSLTDSYLSHEVPARQLLFLNGDPFIVKAGSSASTAAKDRS